MSSPVKRKSGQETASPKKQKVEIPHTIYVLDRSGSMKQYGEEGYGSIQAAIEELPKSRGRIVYFQCSVSTINTRR